MKKRLFESSKKKIQGKIHLFTKHQDYYLGNIFFCHHFSFSRAPVQKTAGASLHIIHISTKTNQFIDNICSVWIP